MFEFIDTMDFERLHECFDEHIAYARPGYPLLEGRERVLRFYREERVIKSGMHRVVRSVREGDNLFVAGKFAGEARDGTAIPELEFADWYLLRDEKVLERRTYFHTPLV